MLDDTGRGYLEMSELLESSPIPKPHQPEEIVEGEVVQISDEGVMVSIGLKTEGMVPPQEMRTLASEEQKQLKPGDRILVMVLGEEGSGGLPTLSVDRAHVERTWQDLREHLESGTAVTARASGYNRGGMVVDIGGIRGFVPFSHLAPVPNDEDRDEVLESRVGEEADFHVMEVDRPQEKLVLSERAIWRERREEARYRFILGLKEGTIIRGKVTSLREFGVFVDLSETDGLVPLSEISWATIKSADEVVKLGDEVDVYVLRVDPENRRVTLSMKRAQADPWESAEERYDISQIVQGVVTRLAPFGAFVKLEDGLEGLIHISELSWRRVSHSKECVYLGQKVMVMVLNIDSESHRMSLSFKQAYE